MVEHGSFDTPSAKRVLTPRIRIGGFLGYQLIGLKVEKIADDQLAGLTAGQLSYFYEARLFPLVRLDFGGQDQRLLVRYTLDQSEWRGDDVHFSVTYQDISVTTKTPDTFVLVLIFMVRIQKVAVAEHKVKHWVAVPIGSFRVAAENVIDRPAVMKSGRRLTIAVETGVAPRIRQPFQLVSLRRLNHTEVRVAVSPSHLKIQLYLFESPFEPILEVEFLVCTAYELNQRSLPNRFDAASKNQKWCHDN